MPPETSADLVVLVEHPARVPIITTANKDRHGLSIFIISPFDTNVADTARQEPNVIPTPLPAETITPAGGVVRDVPRPCDHLRSTDRVWSVESQSPVAGPLSP
jgi:hypothetical protein